jgi:3-methyladenine DNA glycosylase AlkD
MTHLNSKDFSQLKNELQKLGDANRAKRLAGFFKTRPGEYGEGDTFLGVNVPSLRILARKYKELSISEIDQLLASPIHEERMVSLLLLIHKYSKSHPNGKKELVEYYLRNAGRVNNWDLVDLSAPQILGEYLLKRKDRKVLFELSKSKNLWERRISIISTLTFVKDNQYEDALKISLNLLNDKHDLIHKAVGWMLREVGNRNLSKEESFLEIHYQVMPRTMLRYAIEKFPERRRRDYLEGKI